MSVPYHLEIYSTDRFKLMMNYSGIVNDIADANLCLNIFAIDAQGMPIFTERLYLDHIRKVFKHLNSVSIIREDASVSSKFVETTDEINVLLESLKESDLQVILTLLGKFKSENKIIGLLESLSDLEIENLHGAYHHKLIVSEISNLKKLLLFEENGNVVDEVYADESLIKYQARQPEKVFQNWIEQNLWIFGVDYIKKHDARKIALFSEGDLLMESVDGYLDLIELKRPSHDLLKYDASHKCYYPHPDLSIVIGQSLFYLQKLEEYKLNLEKEYSIKVIMPRIRIIVGCNKSFNDDQRDCLRVLNSKLNSIQIITYDDLVSYGVLLLKQYEY
ncbi:Shedu anti-phage system protein SduA domain-containing protein [Paenibacillus polymyxa]|uniref:Shedu anti-phage system protein SduA domain-containing protein n=1 Tax=Paenibacillus TaxID=44249 RepID=UPI0020245711|nr:Shedu anti-phage system protein SduA domain-containing protein [Paenibacillus polymyxa]URJ38235.1 DUF4263 domain-containing protein [Paenibacillus polymyxa]